MSSFNYVCVRAVCVYVCVTRSGCHFVQTKKQVHQLAIVVGEGGGFSPEVQALGHVLAWRAGVLRRRAVSAFMGWGGHGHDG